VKNDTRQIKYGPYNKVMHEDQKLSKVYFLPSAISIANNENATAGC
jgi:hypothetical protein